MACGMVKSMLCVILTWCVNARVRAWLGVRAWNMEIWSSAATRMRWFSWQLIICGFEINIVNWSKHIKFSSHWLCIWITSARVFCSFYLIFFLLSFNIYWCFFKSIHIHFHISTYNFFLQQNEQLQIINEICSLSICNFPNEMKTYRLNDFSEDFFHIRPHLWWLLLACWSRIWMNDFMTIYFKLKCHVCSYANSVKWLYSTNPLRKSSKNFKVKSLCESLWSQIFVGIKHVRPCTA